MRELDIPRPRTRGECLEEARPCPWVGCRHHLLLELPASGKRDPGLVRNLKRTQTGRRLVLKPSAAAEIVRAWIDDAVEDLAAMTSGCSLDEADRGAQARMAVAGHVGLSRESIRVERRAAIAAVAQARQAVPR
jgi:hypothetical protein